MKVQCRLMQARFIEIHQILAKKKVGYFSNILVHAKIKQLQRRKCQNAKKYNKQYICPLFCISQKPGFVKRKSRGALALIVL